MSLSGPSRNRPPPPPPPPAPTPKRLGNWDLAQSPMQIGAYRAGLNPRRVGQLRQFQYSPQATLDLDKVPPANAKAEFETFMAMACTKRMRCVQVIQGDSLPLAKRVELWRGGLQQWLLHDSSASPHVAAFLSHPKDPAVTIVLQMAP